MSEPVSAAELERLLAAAATDPAARPAFTRAILESEVYVLGSLDRPLVDGVAAAGSTMHVVTISDDEGPLTPFFTSEAMVAATVAARPGTEPEHLRLSARALFEMTLGSRLVLNPDGPNGKLYLPNEVRSLLAGTEPGLSSEVLEEDRQVLIGSPAHIPPDLPSTLARLFVQRPAVDAVHLGWIAHPDGHQGYLLVVVSDDRERAMDGFGTLQITELTGGETVDVLVVPSGTRDHYLSTTEPFYVRQPQDDTPSPPKQRRRLFGR